MISEHFINAFKTVLACSIGFSAIHLLKLPSSQWVIITILIVMTAQIHFGGAVQKAYLRLLGTVVGALIAGAALYFFNADNIFAISSIILISAFMFSFLGGLSPAMGQSMTLGSVTVPIILLSPNVTLSFAFLRMGEILLGIFIALFINLLVFPLHAKHKLNALLIKNMKELKNYNSNSEKIMMDNFARAQQLLEDASREPGVNKKHYHAILLHQKRLFRAVSLLEYFPAANLHAFIEQELLILMKLAER